MQDEPEDIDEWCQQLAGKGDPGTTPPQLAVLRSVIQASDRTASDATAADAVAHARLIKRLEAEGLLAQASAARTRWPLWVASAASLLLAIVAFRILVPDVDYRGSAGSIVILSAQPQVERAQVAQQLRALGLEPRAVTEDDRVVIEVDVSAAQLEAFYNWAQPRGGRPKTAGTYRIFVAAESP